jgi:hypothetical protein
LNNRLEDATLIIVMAMLKGEEQALPGSASKRLPDLKPLAAENLGATGTGAHAKKCFKNIEKLIFTCVLTFSIFCGQALLV